MNQPRLSLQQVSCQGADRRIVLQDISFDAAAGECLVIAGAMGAGKTTLLKLINRLIERDQGHIFLDGQEIRQIPVVDLRQQITLVLQEPKLLGMTVRQTLAYPLQLRGLTPTVVTQRLQYWSEQLQIPTDWFDRTEVQLSQGQKQLVAIARALMIQPLVLLCDEPTAALDRGTGQRVIQCVKSLTETTATTVVMVSHQLDWVQQFADRWLYLKQGRLVQDFPSRSINWATLQQQLAQEQAEAIAEWE
ncbi:MAG: ATP-binding cassette domain-containing protein [Elainella sp. Prado103]|nr:ATP-binding cassette domain-containing protein [Elainella sp. Prado103]